MDRVQRLAYRTPVPGRVRQRQLEVFAEKSPMRTGLHIAPQWPVESAKKAASESC